MQALIFYLFSCLMLGSAVMVVSARNPVHSVFFLILAFFNAAGLFILVGAEFLAMMLVVVYVGAIAVLFLFVVMMLDLKPSRMKVSWGARIKISLRHFAALFAYLFLVGGITASIFASLTFTFPGFDVSNLARLRTFEILCGFFALGVGVVSTELIFRWAFQKSWSKVFRGFSQTMPIAGFIFLLLLLETLAVVFLWSRSLGSEEILMAPTPPAMVLSNTHALGQLIYTDYIYVFQAAGMILLVAMIGAIVLTVRRRPDFKRQDVRSQVYRDPKDAVELKTVKMGQRIGRL